MERAAFLLEQSGERLGCLLNPNQVLVRRTAGIRRQQSYQGPLIGRGLADDPLIYTGGGSTELLLNLLFDVSVAGSSIVTEDVRDLTGPICALAENAAAPDGYGEPPLIRFVWGKYWNVPGIIASVAERLEFFTEGGAPRRSWLSLRLLRVSESTPRVASQPRLPARLSTVEPVASASAEPAGARVHQVLGAGEQGGTGSTERMDELAQRYCGDPEAWRWIAEYNNIDDPLHIPPGTLLRVPPSAIGAKP
jgi:hypothetical protein